MTDLEKRLAVIERRQTLIFQWIKARDGKFTHHWKMAPQWVEKNEAHKDVSDARRQVRAEQQRDFDPYHQPEPEEKPTGWIGRSDRPLTG